jgi:predicted methyltransferase
MPHLKALAAASAALIFSAASVSAQACTERDTLAEHLSNKYGETLSAGGLRDSQSVLEVWISQDGGTWTLLLTQADGTSCIMAAGTNWRGALQAEAVVGTPS